MSGAEASLRSAFFKPVVTPVELQIALGVRPWSVSLSTDVQSVLEYADAQESDAKEQQQLVEFDSAAAEHFSQRSFQGLQARTDMHYAIEDAIGDANSNEYTIHEGRSGVASGYEMDGAEL
jgi:hypothetical protein